MAHIQAKDSYYDSDDELPTLDALLTRLPGRTQYQHSQSKPISYPKLKNTTFIQLEERDNSVKGQITNKVDSFLELGDITPEHAIQPLVKGEIQKRWQSSPEQLGDDVGGEGESPPRPRGRLIDAQGSGLQELSPRIRMTKKSGSNIPSRIGPQVSIRHPRGPSETTDDASRNSSLNAGNSALRSPQSQSLTAERLCNSDQEEPITRHPRNNISLNRSQIMKPGHQSQFPRHEDGGDIIRPFSRLRLDHQDPLGGDISQSGAGTPSFPIVSPKKSKQKRLVSPNGEVHIKETRSQEPSAGTVRQHKSDDEWDDPRINCKTKPTRSAVPKTTSPKKQTKKSFDARKSQLAIDFLQQLDTQITHGKIGELTESTGGVKIVWSNTLKTTAGRANWKRETMISKQTGGSAKTDVKQYRHHSSIELAEKIIDDEQRLLNVIAHEFCHLANFMINGITDNPHGKEFKVWAGKCSQLFGSQGIKVTTKHTYEIDFKYVWTCTACGCEYKRHSKSIDPKRHRCGACKALLEQTKPTPRQTPTTGQLSGYQLFVKEQMKVVKSENPNSPQKEIMRIIADKWAKVKS